MGGNLMYADRRWIKRVDVFHACDGCVSFCVDHINPAWKHNAIRETSIITSLNRALVVEGGSWINRRRIVVRHRALLECHRLAQYSWRSPGVLEPFIGDFCFILHFLSTMQYVIGIQ
jgi:hypothetical protein